MKQSIIEEGLLAVHTPLKVRRAPKSRERPCILPYRGGSYGEVDLTENPDLPTLAGDKYGPTAC